MRNILKKYIILLLVLLATSFSANAEMIKTTTNTSEIHMSAIRETITSNDSTTFYLQGDLFWKSNSGNQNNISNVSQEYGKVREVYIIAVYRNLENKSTEYIKSNKQAILHNMTQDIQQIAESKYGITILKITYMDIFPRTLYNDKVRFVLEVKGTSFTRDLKHAIHSSMEIYYIDTVSGSENERLYHRIWLKNKAEQLLSETFQNMSSEDIFKNQDNKIREIEEKLKDIYSKKGIQIQEVRLDEISSSPMPEKSTWSFPSFLIGMLIMLLLTLTFPKGK